MTRTVLVEVHPQPHILVKKPQSPELLQNKTILFIAHNGQDIWVIGWKVEKKVSKRKNFAAAWKIYENLDKTFILYFVGKYYIF